MSVPRPFRARAFEVRPVHEQDSRTRPIVGRAAACSEAGLAAFRERHEAQGHLVETFEVLDLLDEIPPE